MPKSFKDKMVNPAYRYISHNEEDTQPQTSEETSDAPHKARPSRRAMPQYGEEAKTRRLQLLLQPSLYSAIKAKAVAMRMSVNELICEILKDAIENEEE